jgi:hypothetical protein
VSVNCLSGNLESEVIHDLCIGLVFTLIALVEFVVGDQILFHLPSLRLNHVVARRVGKAGADLRWKLTI